VIEIGTGWGGFAVHAAGLEDRITVLLEDYRDLPLVHLEDIGPHYATTLAAWRRNFHARLDEVRRLGYPDAFIRMWEYYLCYCEAGFAARALGDVHMVMTREG
jgi:cyclopropane-fatty-acyl-phospholipid synthase